MFWTNTIYLQPSNLDRPCPHSTPDVCLYKKFLTLLQKKNTTNIGKCQHSRSHSGENYIYTFKAHFKSRGIHSLWFGFRVKQIIIYLLHSIDDPDDADDADALFAKNPNFIQLKGQQIIHILRHLFLNLF